MTLSMIVSPLFFFDQTRPAIRLCELERSTDRQLTQLGRATKDVQVDGGFRNRRIDNVAVGSTFVPAAVYSKPGDIDSSETIDSLNDCLRLCVRRNHAG